MTTEPKYQKNETGLLSSAEHSSLSQIAEKNPPFSQRAQALLAIDDGASQSSAALLTGLTTGQVRYWLDKFRNGRMSIFPEELLDQAQQEEGESPPITAEPVSPPDSPEFEQIAAEEDVQQETPAAKETVAPVDDTAESQEDPRKKSKKKSKKSRKEKKTKKVKKSRKKAKKKKPKKSKKGKKPAKKSGKKKSKKAKVSKGKSGKKKQEEA